MKINPMRHAKRVREATTTGISGEVHWTQLFGDCDKGCCGRGCETDRRSATGVQPLSPRFSHLNDSNQRLTLEQRLSYHSTTRAHELRRIYDHSPNGVVRSRPGVLSCCRLCPCSRFLVRHRPAVAGACGYSRRTRHQFSRRVHRSLCRDRPVCVPRPEPPAVTPVGWMSDPQRADSALRWGRRVCTDPRACADTRTQHSESPPRRPRHDYHLGSRISHHGSQKRAVLAG